MKINREDAKKIISAVVGACAANTVSRALANNVHNETPLQTAISLVASVGVGVVVSSTVREHMDDYVDETFQQIDLITQAIEEQR